MDEGTEDVHSRTLDYNETQEENWKGALAADENQCHSRESDTPRGMDRNGGRSELASWALTQGA